MQLPDEATRRALATVSVCSTNVLPSRLLCQLSVPVCLGLGNPTAPLAYFEDSCLSWVLFAVSTLTSQRLGVCWL